LIIASAGFFYEGVVYDYGHQFPGKRFLLLDASFDPPLDNVWTVTYATDQGAFLAGYLAAAMTQSGVIGTFGGVDFPVVTDYMIGFESGMHYYNQKNGTYVKLLGWDTTLHEGDFLNSFSDMDLAAQTTMNLIEQGADIIFPVAGSGPGSAALQVVMEQGHAYLIGVDQEYIFMCPECADHVLTSVLKRLDKSVLRAADAIAAGIFKGDTYFGTLETGEVDLAPYYELESLIPDQIKAEMEQLKADIIAGKIQTKADEY
jgi:basic membrane protein A